MTDPLPRDTAELLSLIDQEWNALLRVVERLTPQQMVTPDAGGWSPKDNLAHLAAWMRYMKDSYLHKMPAPEAWGMDPEKWKHLDENGINAVLFERNRDRPAAEVLTGLKTTYEDIVVVLETTPFADLMKRLRESGPDTRLVIDSVLGNTSDHFREHRLIIEKGL